VKLLILAFLLSAFSLFLYPSTKLPQIKGVQQASKESLSLGSRESYRANVQDLSQAQLTALKQKKACQTVSGSKQSAPPSLLNMSYEMGAAVGIKDPHIMYIVNDSQKMLACIGPKKIEGKECRAISLNFRNLKKYSVGVSYLALGHEWAHEIARIKFRPKAILTTVTNRQKQDNENFCDKTAVIKRNCKQCAREFAAFFVDLHNSELTEAFGVKLKKTSLHQLSLLSDQRLTNLILATSLISRDHANTHPFALERALRVEKLSRQIISLCALHKPKTPCSASATKVIAKPN